MRARTFIALQAEAMALADCGNDPHITEADDGAGSTVNLAALWVNQGIADLWRKLVRVSPDRYLRSVDLTTTAGTLAYDIATMLDDADAETLDDDDFMAIRRVDLIQGTRRIAVQPFAWQEPPYRSQDSRGGGMTRYRVVGQGVDGTESQIYFDPDPGSNTYRIWYISRPPVLSADGDTFDGVAGFEDYATAFAALRMMVRQETDPSALMAEMARIESSIVATAANRDVGRAPRIADVRPRGRY